MANEKSNRSIEILVTTTNSRDILFGKVFAGTVATFFQVGLIMAALLISYNFNKDYWGGFMGSVLNIPSDVLIAFAVFGLGGFLFCLNSCAGFVEQAKGLEMDAISSAVIGGTLLSGGVGTPIGTLFGVLIKGTISSLITTQGTLSSWWVRIVLSALLCFFIVLQSVFASLKKKN